AASEVVGQPMTTLVPDQNGLQARHRAGYCVPVDIMLTPQTVGDSTHTLCIIRDLTVQKELEARLSISEAEYKHLVEHASDVFYRVEIDDDPFRGLVTYVSPQAETLTGYPAEMFIRDSTLWMQLVHPADLPVVAAATQAILNSGTAGTREYRIRHRDGDQYAWV